MNRLVDGTDRFAFRSINQWPRDSIVQVPFRFYHKNGSLPDSQEPKSGLLGARLILGYSNRIDTSIAKKDLSTETEQLRDFKDVKAMHRNKYGEFKGDGCLNSNNQFGWTNFGPYGWIAVLLLHLNGR